MEVNVAVDAVVTDVVGTVVTIVGVVVWAVVVVAAVVGVVGLVVVVTVVVEDVVVKVEHKAGAGSGFQLPSFLQVTSVFVSGSTLQDPMHLDP